MASADEYVLTIKNHYFTPSVLEVPSGQKVKLIVDNRDATAEEFESYELNREKVVDGNSKITVFIGPLDPGTYPYFGDFHKDLANGKIVVK
jgi:plastocyanin